MKHLLQAKRKAKAKAKTKPIYLSIHSLRNKSKAGPGTGAGRRRDGKGEAGALCRGAAVSERRSHALREREHGPGREGRQGRLQASHGQGGVVVLTLEVLADAQGAFDVMRMAGRPVVVAVAPVQPELELGGE